MAVSSLFEIEQLGDEAEAGRFGGGVHGQPCTTCQIGRSITKARLESAGKALHSAQSRVERRTRVFPKELPFVLTAQWRQRAWAGLAQW